MKCQYAGDCIELDGEIPIPPSECDCYCENLAAWVIRGPLRFRAFNKYRLAVCKGHMEYLTTSSEIKWSVEGKFEECGHLIVVPTEGGKEDER